VNVECIRVWKEVGFENSGHNRSSKYETSIFRM